MHENNPVKNLLGHSAETLLSPDPFKFRGLEKQLHGDNRCKLPDKKGRVFYPFGGFP